jgi:LAGLIDADG endonuclease
MAKENGPNIKEEENIYGNNALLMRDAPENTICKSSYLAGLFEGDGHIWISKNLTKKKHNPRFCITFSLKNEPLAKKLLDILEYGHLAYKPKDNACVLTVSPVKGLKRVVSLLNGQLRTPKINQLYLLIDWLNKNHGSKINKLPINTGNLSDDSWLAGFVDADGSFSIQHTKKEDGALKRKVSCRLRIEQRMIEPKTNESYFSVMNEIAQFLNCNLLTRKQLSTGNEYYTIAATSRNSLIIITNYFEAFPLFSSKYLDYLDWSKAVKLILSNEHYTDANLLLIDDLKSKMNRARTEFNWDHLN